MEKIATADYEYTEQVHQMVTLVRRQRSMRTIGLVISVVFLTLLVVLILNIASGTTLDAPTVVLLIVLLVGSVFGLWLAFSSLRKVSRASEEAIDAFFRGHGLTEKHHSSWSMRERVEVEEGGIAVCWGPVGCKTKDLVRVFQPWSEWKYFIQTDDLLVIICRTPEDGLFKNAAGVNPTEDGRYADAAIPWKKLQGMSQKELVELLRDKIGA